MEQTPKMRTFFAAMCPAFFMRVRPASRKAKPACMNITRIAVTTTQMVLAATRRSLLDTELHLLEAPPRPVVRHVADGRRPDDPVAHLIVTPSRNINRNDTRRGNPTLDKQCRNRATNKTRLKNAPASLKHKSTH